MFHILFDMGEKLTMQERVKLVFVFGRDGGYIPNLINKIDIHIYLYTNVHGA